ncbi:MAG: hypothetical protein ACTSPY_07545 [Candidatus Helarchaeota archaeon]
MIESLIIINAGGICIYNKNFTTSKIDEQLLSGFLIAVSNFSKEIMREGELQKIDAKDQKIVAYEDKELGLTIAAITGALDHDSLLLKVLKKILIEFDQKYHDVLDDPKISSYNKKFDSIAKDIVNQYVSRRSGINIFFGLITGITLSIMIFILQGGIFIKFAEVYLTTIAPASDPIDLLIPFAIFSIELELIGFITFSPSSFLTGYIAGSRKRGIYIGIALSLLLVVFSIIYLIIVAILISHTFFIFVAIGFMVLLITYLPLIIIINFVFSYLGGLVKDKHRLYPLPPEKVVHIDV